MGEPKIIFETPRLIVRNWVESDAEQAFAIYSDPDVIRFLGDGKQKPVADVEVMRTAICERWPKRFTEPNFGLWAAERKDNGQIVGAILLTKLDELNEVEVGWHLGKFAWGNGFATEGGRGAIAHGFGACKLSRIIAIVYPENRKSIEVTKRLGMKHEGQRRVIGNEFEYFSIESKSRGC